MNHIRLRATTVSVGLALQTWLCQLDFTNHSNTDNLLLECTLAISVLGRLEIGECSGITVHPAITYLVSSRPVQDLFQKPSCCIH